MISQRQLLTLRVGAQARALRLALIDHDNALADVHESDFHEWTRHTCYPQSIGRWVARLGREAKKS